MSKKNYTQKYPNKDEKITNEVGHQYDQRSVEKSSKKRIGIFLENWVQTGSLGVQVYGSSLKTWRKDQIIREESDLELLISKNAPMQVYIEDGGIY